MARYFLKRLLLIPPTLLGILLLNFAIIQAAPGGPVEQILAQMHSMDSMGSTRIGAASSEVSSAGVASNSSSSSGSSYRGSRGVDAEFIAELERQFGFDKPPVTRFFLLVKQYLSFDLGESFFQGKKVSQLIIEKLPVSISLGLWSTLLIYLISIPLGIAKALKHGSKFDFYTSGLIIFAYAIPGFLFAILLIVLFAGGNYLSWFPLRGLTSDNFHELSTLGQIADYFWHLALPVLAITISGFATLTLLTKNSFLDEIHKQYVLTARAKGLSQQKVLYGHIFRNAMLIIIAGMPAALVSVFFTGSLLIEVIFSLDGLGLLGFEAVVQRDYPVVFGTLYLFTLVGLLLKLISDFTYVLIDPRIDFSSREG